MKKLAGRLSGVIQSLVDKAFEKFRGLLHLRADLAGGFHSVFDLLAKFVQRAFELRRALFDFHPRAPDFQLAHPALLLIENSRTFARSSSLSFINVVLTS